MKNYFITRKGLVAMSFLISACVTDPKASDKVYLKPEADSLSGGIPTKIKITCQVQNGRTKKAIACAKMSVRIKNNVSGDERNETIKGGVANLEVGADVYDISVETTGCSTVRTLSGIMAGMDAKVFFDPPCGTP